MTDSPYQEIEIPFAGKVYRRRPTFLLIAAIESATNQASRPLGMKFLSGDQASILEIAVVVHRLIGDEAKMDLNEIGEAIMEDGYGDLMLPLGQFLTRALKGNKEHEKEALAAQKKAKEAAAQAGAGPRKDPS